MKQSRIMERVFIIFVGATLMLLLSPQIASSLGVAPSLYNLDNAQTSYDLKVKVINSQQDDLFVRITPEGILADYVVYEDKTYHLTPDENLLTVPYRLIIPDDLPPGQNVLNMIVSEDPNYNNQNNGVAITTTINVAQKVLVQVPYPDTYIVGELFIDTVKPRQPLPLMMHVINKGEEATYITGTLYIRGPTNEILSTTSLDEIPLAGISDKKVYFSGPELDNIGNYVAEVILKYGDEELVLTKNFIVGEEYIEAKEIRYDKFRLGEIVHLYVDIHNYWNQRIEDVTADIKIIDKSGQTVSRFRSLSADVSSHSNGVIDAYWDTDGIGAGVYDVDVYLEYSGQITENYFKAVVGANSLSLTKEDMLTGEVISGEGTDGNSKITLLIILVLVLIGINVAWMTMLRNKKNKKEDE